MDVAGSVALVTGANRGLGAAFCRALLDQGASKVYAGARDPDTIQVAGVIPVRLDITSPADVAAAVAQCGDTTLLVNNAGHPDRHIGARRRRARRWTARVRDQCVRHPLDESRLRPRARGERWRGDHQRPVRAVVVQRPGRSAVLRVEGRRLVAHQRIAARPPRPTHTGRCLACRVHGHRHGSGRRRTEGITRRRRCTGPRRRRGGRVRGPRRRHQPLRARWALRRLDRAVPGPRSRRRHERGTGVRHHLVQERTRTNRHGGRCHLRLPRARAARAGCRSSSSFTWPPTWTTGIRGSSIRSLSAIT